MKMTAKITLRVGTMQHSSRSISKTAMIGLCMAALFTISSVNVVFVDTSFHMNRINDRQIIEESPDYKVFENAGKS